MPLAPPSPPLTPPPPPLPSTPPPPLPLVLPPPPVCETTLSTVPVVVDSHIFDEPNSVSIAPKLASKFLFLPRPSRLHPPPSRRFASCCIFHCVCGERPARRPPRAPGPGSILDVHDLGARRPSRARPSTVDGPRSALAPPRSGRPPPQTPLPNRDTRQKLINIYSTCVTEKASSEGRPARVRTGHGALLTPPEGRARPSARSGPTARQPLGTIRTPRQPLLRSAMGPTTLTAQAAARPLPPLTLGTRCGVLNQRCCRILLRRRLRPRLGPHVYKARDLVAYHRGARGGLNNLRPRR